MKKSTSILAVAAVAGLSALTASPASAIVGAAYANCTAAAAAGAFNIPVGDPGYGTHLDSDGDGVGCERAVEGGTAVQAPAQSQVGAQVARKPVGGAPTGVEQETNNAMSFLALGGLVAAAATTTVLVRRRAAVKA
ncbi:excalibur calcium-binding domain-containing protein [Pseudarthrobacter sp. NPDC055928]|uniref:excalibur calcium-binding domain-containing protein n=1 Tax=Pseudarthrobacter sp. NPDC055928 TaxID=3345661 RepID=UPI0035DCB56E